MIRKLAGQTAIYGIPSIVGRLINFLLVFLFTEYFKPDIFAAHVEFYAYAAFFLVVLPHGMETAFFNFLRRDEPRKKVFATAFLSVGLVALLFLILIFLFDGQIADFMYYPEHPEYVRWFGLILFFDAMAMLPFALLRHLKQAGRFAFIRSTGIFVNILLNVIFIVYFPRWFDHSNLIYNPDIGIGYVFIANLIASGIMALMLLPDTFRNFGNFDFGLWRKMFIYAWPLILVGLAGIVNETFDRAAMQKLLISDNPKFEIGVYGAFYKLSIIITIFIQAFRYAAEPFFFERSKEEDARLIYARVMNYFVMVCLAIALFTLVFLEYIAPIAIRQEAFFSHPDGLKIVAPLLLANIFLGINYNLSIWYKVEERNKTGAAISIFGALTTIILLIVFIPRYGFIAAAYITLLVYALMAILSYMLGQRYYPVPYDVRKLSLLFISALAIYIIDLQYFTRSSPELILIKAILCLAYILVCYLVVIRVKKS